MSDHAAAIRGLPRWHPEPLVQDTIHRIRAHGWSVTAVSELCAECSEDCEVPDCAFAYSTGLTLHSIPELIVYGLDAGTSGAVINELGDLLHRCDWTEFVQAGTEICVAALDVPLRLVELVDKDDMRVSNVLFPDAPALQVVWPDDWGRFPWDDEYALEPVHQPVKGVLPDPGVRDVGPRVISRSYGPNRKERRRRKPTAG
ncbi:DUF4262 domain-containing protein [Gordonia sp. HNM0687]|uniref:DUF4262 domain-containing protein n=1 Tax=Gordonia mangrovi TaxID=2665643 RepID=A0A6L7GPP4_9ACTN|nr:DUF4262 domain-containing protein [Gordonia mangrovi]MXP20518.1 DUF4262 domain-containing protein [Gordonia mangrovi]UVF78889.1 DUF4262 domain-containing protein [Gordonia mangrovi]